MCGCPICGQTTYGALGHASREQCVNALKGALRAAREGREMVRETLTAERDSYRDVMLTPREIRGLRMALIFGVPDPEPDEIMSARAKLNAAESASASDDQQRPAEGGEHKP